MSCIILQIWSCLIERPCSFSSSVYLIFVWVAFTDKASQTSFSPFEQGRVVGTNYFSLHSCVTTRWQ